MFQLSIRAQDDLSTMHTAHRDSRLTTNISIVGLRARDCLTDAIVKRQESHITKINRRLFKLKIYRITFSITFL